MTAKEFIKKWQTNRRLIRSYLNDTYRSAEAETDLNILTNELEIMKQIIMKLDSPYREVIIYCYLKRMPLKAVAEKTGYSYGYLSMSKKKALDKLEAMILKCGW